MRRSGAISWVRFVVVSAVACAAAPASRAAEPVAPAATSADQVLCEAVADLEEKGAALRVAREVEVRSSTELALADASVVQAQLRRELAVERGSAGPDAVPDAESLRARAALRLGHAARALSLADAEYRLAEAAHALVKAWREGDRDAAESIEQSLAATQRRIEQARRARVDSTEWTTFEGDEGRPPARPAPPSP